MNVKRNSHLASVVRAKEEEQGFTLIEVIVGLVLITTLALFTLPLMANGLRYTSISSTSTSANSRVQQAVEQARISPVTCASLSALTGTRSYTDGRGFAYTIQVTLPSGCTASTSAQAVPLRVVARRTLGNLILTDLTTKILVPGVTP